MTATRLAVTLLAVAPAIAAAQGPLRVNAITIGEPARIAELDMDKLKGQPFRLAWSPDGSQLYVQTLEGSYGDVAKGRSTVKLRHYIFKAAGGDDKKDVQGPPDWFGAYWNDKSRQYPEGAPALAIDARNEMRKQTATSMPMGGDLARGGPGGTTGSSAGDVAAASYATQTVPVTTLVYKGQKIGEFVNSVFVPGLTYAWGPAGTNIMAFTAVDDDLKVTIVDDQGGKKTIDGTKESVLPAWSQDGSKLAWLQKDGRKKFQLYVASVTRS